MEPTRPSARPADDGCCASAALPLCLVTSGKVPMVDSEGWSEWDLRRSTATGCACEDSGGRASVTRSTVVSTAQHRGLTSLCCTCCRGWGHLLPGQNHPQDSAASVGPGLYKLFLFTCTQEVVLGSAVTPIKGARLRSIRMHRPCLALPRLALPRLGALSLSLSETEQLLCALFALFI